MDANDELAIDSSLGGVVVPLIELGDELADSNIGAAVAACIWALAALAAGWLGLRSYLKLRKHWGLWWDDHLLTVVSGRESFKKDERLLTSDVEVLGKGKRQSRYVDNLVHTCF